MAQQQRPLWLSEQKYTEIKCAQKYSIRWWLRTGFIHVALRYGAMILASHALLARDWGKPEEKLHSRVDGGRRYNGLACSYIMHGGPQGQTEMKEDKRRPTIQSISGQTRYRIKHPHQSNIEQRDA